MTESESFLSNLIVFAAFAGLLASTIASSQGRHALRHKLRQDWLLDGCGLLIQGVLIPILQLTGVYQLYHLLLPSCRAVLDLPGGLEFLISFVLVDYLYYWNHRWLHSWAWRWHRVHHTVTNLDVLGTSRNSVWTNALIIYLWIHPLMLYLLNHSQGYLLGMGLTAALDLWRHSSLHLPPAWNRWLGWLILPQDHAWHHASTHCNYSANLNWDRWHNTACSAASPPERLGLPLQLSLFRQLFWP